MEQKATKNNLKKHHYRAVELRYEGKTYENITTILAGEFKRQFHESTIRKWFMSKGALEALYLDYANKENDRRRKLVMEEMKKLTQQIPSNYQQLLKTLKDGINHPAMAGIMRATLRDLCEMLGFRVEELDNTNPVDDFFDRVEQQVENEGSTKNPK